MKKMLRSFICAFTGLKFLFREERNAKIHLLAALIVISAGFYFGVSAMEWFMLIISIALVFAAEAVNTAIEILCDMVYAEQHPLIKKIKDLSAASVLVLALAALITAGIVFWDKLTTDIIESVLISRCYK